MRGSVWGFFRWFLTSSFLVLSQNKSVREYISMLTLLTILSLFTVQDATDEMPVELIDIYFENRESIDKYAETLTEPVGDEELIEGWKDQQPISYEGFLRDRRRRRRTSDEQAEADEYQPEKPTIWNRRKVIREGKAAGAKWLRVILGGGLAVMFAAIGLGIYGWFTK